MKSAASAAAGAKAGAEAQSSIDNSADGGRDAPVPGGDSAGSCRPTTQRRIVVDCRARNAAGGGTVSRWYLHGSLRAHADSAHTWCKAGMRRLTISQTVMALPMARSRATSRATGCGRSPVAWFWGMRLWFTKTRMTACHGPRDRTANKHSQRILPRQAAAARARGRPARSRGGETQHE